MEQKDIDIYEILKGMPDGTQLYTPMCGNVELTSVEEDKEKLRAIWTENKNGAYSFDKHGKWTKGGEVLLINSGKSDSFTSCIPFEGNEDIAFTDHDYMPF